MMDVIGYKVDPMLSQFLSLYERSISQFYNEKHDSRYWGNILIFYSVERPQIASNTLNQKCFVGDTKNVCCQMSFVDTSCCQMSFVDASLCVFSIRVE